ncbi:MAG: YhdP family protein, partial [Gammaproteobacteria bacterium]
FQDLSASPWRSAPGVRNARGYVALDASGGHVDLDSGAITLEFPRLYHQDLDFAIARGRVSWSRDPGGLRVGSELLQLQDDVGAYAARFGLRLNRDPEIEDEFTLAVGMGAGDVSLRDRFVPYTVDERLRAWIDRAVLGGRVGEGSFAMRSAFGRPDGSRALSVQLALGLAEAAVDFHPDWPPVTGARGRLLVDGRVTRVQLEDGEILGSRIRDVRVNVQPGPDGRRVLVDGRVESDLGAVLRFVNGSPLARITRGALREWRGSGPVGLDLDLDLPLAKAPVPGNARIDVRAELAGNRLSLGGLGITLDGLGGALDYGMAGGLSSERLDASLWGRPVTARIGPSPGRKGAMRIEAEGVAGVPDIERWLGVAVGDAVSGETAFRLQAEQGEHGFDTQVETGLDGITSVLPAPLGKAAGESRALRVDWSARGEGVARVSASLADAGSLEADRDSEGGIAGEILLGEGPAPVAGGEGLRLRGRLGEADAGEWIVATSRLLSQNAGRGIGDGGLRIDGLEVEAARLLGAPLPGLRLDARRRDGDFLLGFSAGEISGEFRAPADRAEPLGLHLATLDLARFLPVKPATPAEPDAQAAAEPAPPPAEDPWSRLAGARVPRLDVRIDALRKGDVALGEWRFRLGSEGEVLAIRDAVATLPGASIGGVAGKGGASLQLSWVEGEPRTALTAGFAFTDAETFFRNAGYEPPVDSRKGRLDLSLAWPGNPLALKMADANGLLDLAFHDGRLLRGGGNNPLMRTFGLLRFDELFRRLRLDFKDFYESGLAFDRFEAGIDVGGGLAKTREPVSLRGPTARLRLSGQTDLRQDLIEADLIVTLPIGSNLPWLAALAGGLPAAAG